MEQTVNLMLRTLISSVIEAVSICVLDGAEIVLDMLIKAEVLLKMCSGCESRRVLPFDQTSSGVAGRTRIGFGIVALDSCHSVGL